MCGVMGGLTTLVTGQCYNLERLPSGANHRSWSSKMRLSIGLSVLFALSVACAAAEQADELGVLNQELSETFAGTLAQNEVASRGPLAVQPGSRLRVVLSGTGDADLYVKFGSRPTLTSYNCRPYEDDSSEECVLTVPANATTVFIDVRGYTASTYSLQVERVGGGGAGGSGGTGGASGAGGTSGSGGSGGAGAGGTGGGSSGGAPIIETFSGTLVQNAAAPRGPFAVQPGSRLRVALSGTGDADLYVRFGSPPTLTSYDCRPYKDDSSEECVLTVPSNVTAAFIDVRGYRASSYSLQLERIAGAGGGSGGSGGAGGAGGTGGAGGSSGGTGATGGAGGSSGGTGGGGQTTEPFVIAVLGSSTAQGEGASSLANSWVGLLEQTLSAEADVRVANLAVSGWATVHLLPGSGAPGNIEAALDEQPDLIVVALGGSNDIDIGASTATYLSDLTRVRDTARAAGIPMFFVGTLPKNMSDADRRLLADWNDQMGDRFATCWVPANTAYTPCFIDVFDELASDDLTVKEEYQAADGFHNNDAGHRVIFQGAIEIIEPYVCTVTECH
jgi:lysophospholipase L1-like esterase